MPNVRFVVIGPHDPAKHDGIAPSETEEAARRAPITFLGARDDLVDWYSAMDLYLLASHREGFPRSAMEAGAMGLPIVATDIRGCREVVVDGRNGYLVPVGDPIAMAEAISSLAADVEQRRSLGREARTYARRHFDQQRVIAITLDVYERLLGTASRAGRPRA